ncbi:phasin family protein [Clostridium sp. MSJ-4]|uniref:Phasin family protein n=1 Tax=Clostridium simiarum TaxID=2841506 RepID=A0ABS6F6Z3_9CLOT|nr:MULTISPECIES: phasin family protein [Clostridium]MBU5593378.1 phasin family protein [Clostridium simiarum]
MMDELKKVFLAGVGSVAYTYEKASKLVEEMVQKGKLSMDEGKELSQELKRNMQASGEKLSEKVDTVKPLNKQEVLEIIQELNLAHQEDLNDVKEKLLKLEAKITSLEKRNE